jgi:hypothetical protein
MKRQLKDILIIGISTLLLAELVLRLLGYAPYVYHPYSIQAKPGKYLLPHPDLGFGLQQGTYTLSINEQINFTAEHGPDGYRITRHPDSLYPGNQTMHCYGCSFSYGLGVNDEQSFAYLLQDKLRSEYQIQNRAVPGYGTTQALLQLNQSIQQGEAPDCAVLLYASFHDERNVLDPSWRQTLYYGFMGMPGGVGQEYNSGKEARFPYARIEEERLVLDFEDKSALYFPFPFREQLSLSNAVQNLFNLGNPKANAVSITVIESIAATCKQEGIEFLVASVVQDSVTSQTLKILDKKGIQTLDMGLDILGDEQYNNQPYDSHPNATAHRIYADRLARFFQHKMPVDPK